MKHFVARIAFAILLAPALLVAQDPDDPFVWLEEVEGQRALAWVEAHNKNTLAELTASPVYKPIYDRILSIINSRNRIAYPSVMGEQLYNFWQDSVNPRGLWRRTTWQSYLSANPKWETVLDIDLLAAAENAKWAYKGSSCLAPAYRLCLVRLSRGGADAVEVREFDTVTKKFVDNGFYLPDAKQSTTWVDANTLLVATNFGEGSMTTSGYARVAKLWRRGTPLTAAQTLFEGAPADVSVGVSSFLDADTLIKMVQHSPAFFKSARYLFNDGKLTQLEIPLDAGWDLIRDQLIVSLRTDWQVGGRTLPGGTLVATNFKDFLKGQRDFEVLVQPGPRETIEGTSTTRDYLLVSMLNNVRGQLRRYRHAEGRWTYDTVPAPALGSINVAETSLKDNRYFFTYTGFTQPTTLYLVDDAGNIGEVKRMPEMFDAKELTVAQYEATSSDGTRIPYFIVHRKDLQPNGKNPTLLHAYGGFEVSMTPGYSATVGASWLERGGVYVVANIRGGGEFGPSWHRAGLKENRQRIYDDFTAVSRDLIARGITSPQHLGITGGSNGGLLVGVAYTQHPELYNAVAVRVPLFDMRRYNKLLAGASWMAEYGNPDMPDEWKYISTYSPYQNIRPGQKYPRVFFSTTTRDDRVHPGHARKGAAKMEALGYPVYYYENTEGGHGSGVTSEQRARMEALQYTYFWQQLGVVSERKHGTN
ncbi:MAG: prolyl oligopeptidase family serine peptidase [Gemmatimonadota bacterium]